MNGKSSPTDPLTPCTECGGGTYVLPGGSIWCPDEDAHPGGFFVTRVAFERRPATEGTPKREWSKQPPKRQPLAPVERRASQPTSKVIKVKPANDGFDTGFDGFVEGER
jgi:hypothetical protein